LWEQFLKHRQGIGADSIIGSKITRNYPLRALVPHALSLSRVPIAAAILFMAPALTHKTWLATVVLIAGAMITDALDGYLARRWNVSSDLGYVLDAIGDRSIHIALILVVFVHYQVNAVLVWLLVLRDIAIYAVRVLARDWLTKSRDLQWLSRFHATNLRLWLASFYVRDGIRVFGGQDRLDTFWFECSQTILITFTIVLSYYGLVKSFGWLTDSVAADTGQS
jgi:phosphatidylglycerophosphate synthase